MKKTLLLLAFGATVSCTKTSLNEIAVTSQEQFKRTNGPDVSESSKKKYLYNLGVQSNGCTLYALIVVQAISVGVLSYYDISVYEVCPSTGGGTFTNYLHYEMGLGWWRSPSTDLLTPEQKSMIEEAIMAGLK